jgi:cell division septal protein FtsQ
MDRSFAPNRDEREKNLFGFSTIKLETREEEEEEEEEERLEKKLREFRERKMRVTCVVKVAILFIGLWMVQINSFDLI